MDRDATEKAIKVFLREIHERLGSASRVAAATEACANAGNVDKGVEVALDIEQLTYEASRLLDAASFINRLSKADA
jgi:hypothetical protein